MDINKIKEDIGEEWGEFERVLKETLVSSSDLLNTINSYLVENNGKQVRPLLSILAARALLIII